VVGISSIRKGHPELLIGNVIGADILNVLFVVGASAAAAPLPIVDPTSSWPEVFLFLQIPTMVVVLLLLRIFIARSVPRGHFVRWYGAPLILISVTFMIAQVVLTR
jgi:cation:H+ antiporter